MRTFISQVWCQVPPSARPSRMNHDFICGCPNIEEMRQMLIEAYQTAKQEKGPFDPNAIVLYITREVKQPIKQEK